MNILSKFKKPILITLILVTLFPILAQPAQAFFTPAVSGIFQFWNAVFQTDEMNLQSFVYETFKATGMSVFTTIFGCLTCPGGPYKQPLFGALGTISNLTAMTYDYRPASGVEYLAYLGKKLDLVPEAYAQGIGFERMEPLRLIWQKFRNIAYVFFVLILVFIGFAIMFRIKISPQAVITIQSALPRIILGLVLITFSYAIVGFLIDIMFVVTNLIISVFSGLSDIPSVMRAALPNPPVTSDVQLGATMLMVGFYPVLMTFFIALLIGGALASVGSLFLTPIIAALAGVAVPLIVAAILLIALIKVFWAILKAYVNVILALIFAPFQILMGTIPGSPAIGSWFKNLLANLAVPPTIFLMVMLAGYLSIKASGGLDLLLLPRLWDVIVGGVPVEEMFPLINDIVALDVNAFIQAVGTMIILFFVSIGMLLMTPRVADMIKGFMSGQPFGYGAAIGQAFGPAAAGYGLAKGPGIQYLGDWAGDKAGVGGISPQAKARWEWIQRGLTGLGYRGK